MAKNWAITIGINGYRYLKSLDYAMSDADAVRQFFQDELKFHQVYHFTDNSPPIQQDRGPDLVSEPTSTTLGRFLRTRFEQPFLGDGDNLWFFFAGHGIRHNNRDYLMPLDGDLGDLERSAIPLHYVSERLRRSGADNVILLIDACRSYEGRRNSLGFGHEKQQGVITLFSCSPEESSYEIQELRQGAFTHVLLDSLRLQGEGNCATVERLYQRLRQYVPQLTRQYKRVSQTPYGVIEPLSKNHLILLPQQATLTDVTTLKNDALTAELARNPKTAKQLWIRVLMVSPADPDAIAGIERLSAGNAVTPRAESASTQSSPASETTSRAVVSTNPTFEFDVVTISRVEKGGLLSLGKPKVITRRHRAKAEYRREALGQGVTLDLVSIPGGTFQMGSQKYDSEKPPHSVTVQPFLLGKYPVAQAQWRVIAALPKVETDLNPEPSTFKGDNRPVEQVSWDEAVEFCQRLSQHTHREYRLPSEAEWEYACRAGKTTPFFFGKTLTAELANYDASYTYGSAPKGQSRKETTDVGSFPANAFGLFDMHGNVWEWCEDHWHENYQGAPTDGSACKVSAGKDLRLLRGGSWYSTPGSCRSANRFRVAHDYRDGYVGLRVVCGSSWTL